MRLGAVSLLMLALTGLVLGLVVAGLPTIITLCILLGIFIFYLTLSHPLLVVTILLVVAPFNILWIGVGITSLELVYSLMFILLVLTWFLKKVLKGILGIPSEDLSSPLTLPLFVFFCVVALACIIGIMRGHRFQHYASDVNALMYYGLGFIMLDVVKDRRTLYRLFVAMLVCTLLGMVEAIYHMKITYTTIDVDVTNLGLTKIRNASAFALLMFIISAAFSVGLPKGPRKVIFILLSFFFCIIQLFSFARSVWLAAVFGIAFLFLVSLPRQRAGFFKLILMAVLALSLYIAVAMAVPVDNPLFKFAHAIQKRYESIFTAKEEPSMMTRGAEWQEANRKAMKHPFFGNGLGTEITYFRYDRWLGTQSWNTTRYIHNAYLYLFLNMGILGLVIFLWFCLSFIRYAFNIRKALRHETDRAFVLGIVSCFVSLMFVSLAGPFLTSPVLTMWLGFFCGVLLVIDRLSKKEKV